MKTLWQVIALVCVLHVLALLGGIGWLAATGRVNRERLIAVGEMLKPTIAEEKAAAQQAAQLDAEAAEHADRVARLSQGGGGSIAGQLASEQQGREVALRQIERTRAEIDSLRRTLQLTRDRIEEQRAALVADQQALQERLDEIEQRENDEGFKKALALYESLPPDQVKQMFMALLEQDQTEQVVTYLAAMQPRTAAKVLKEFQTAAEVDRAVELTQRLRQRGTELTKDLENVG